MNIKIAPSILSADYSCLITQIKELENCGIELIHIDVMDGHFVPNITIGPVILNSIREKTKMLFDTHLMISKPIEFIDKFISAGSDIITVHAETKDCAEAIKKIKSNSVKSGLAINPETPFSRIKNMIDNVDMVLLMTVYPGFSGKNFLPQVLPKIEQTKKYIETQNQNIDIEIDGGINDKNILSVVKAGGNIIVSGSYIFKNIKENIEILRNIISAYSHF